MPYSLYLNRERPSGRLHTGSLGMEQGPPLSALGMGHEELGDGVAVEMDVGKSRTSPTHTLGLSASAPCG